MFALDRVAADGERHPGVWSQEEEVVAVVREGSLLMEEEEEEEEEGLFKADAVD